MADLISNMRIILPFFAFFWILTIVSTALRPYRFRNALFLMGALFFTLVLIAGFFGSNIGYALLYIFLLCMLALLLVPFMLMANGVTMLKKEGFAISHLLSLALGFVILFGEAAVAINVTNESGFLSLGKLSVAAFFVGSGVLYFSLLLLAFVLYMLLLEFMPHRKSFDYIIVHGCGLKSDGSVTKLLSNRLDKAIKLYNHSSVKPVIIPSGGQGPDELRSEAEAMSEYLIENGIPADNILPESNSTTTMENLEFSKKLIECRKSSARIALVSSNYHVYRCLSYARQLKLKCSGVGAKVAFYYWPSAVIREFAAFLKQPRALIPILLGYFLFSLQPTILYWTSLK